MNAEITFTFKDTIINGNIYIPLDKKDYKVQDLKDTIIKVIK